MSKRYIILQPIGLNKGSGVVSISKTTVTVSLSGTDEELRLFFLSSGKEVDKIDAGTIKGGYSKSFELSEENANRIDTVVLIRDTEPVIVGSLAPVIPELNNVVKTKEKEVKGNNSQKLLPLGYDDGFNWLKIEDGRFAENYPIIRHIFENINVISRINDAGFYYYGTKGSKALVAIPSETGSSNPFLHIADCARFINGCWTVGADKRERYFYSIVD